MTTDTTHITKEGLLQAIDSLEESFEIVAPNDDGISVRELVEEKASAIARAELSAQMPNWQPDKAPSLHFDAQESKPVDALALAIRFHETYERLAPQFGYETRKETRAFDPNTPNGKLMVAVCGELIAAVSAQDASPKDDEPVSWAVQLPDGSLSPIGWMDMRQFEPAKRFFQLAEGVKYIFAYREPPHD